MIPVTAPKAPMDAARPKWAPLRFLSNRVAAPRAWAVAAAKTEDAPANVAPVVPLTEPPMKRKNRPRYKRKMAKRAMAEMKAQAAMEEGCSS